MVTISQRRHFWIQGEKERKEEGDSSKIEEENIGFLKESTGRRTTCKSTKLRRKCDKESESEQRAV